MEKAILKTLIYGDIFDYPLKAYEIHKWLIGKQASLRRIEKALEKLIKKKKIEVKKNLYFLKRKERVVRKRIIREKQSARYFKKAKLLVQILKLVPWIKLVGVSGGLAMDNASKNDDIDLILITGKNRLWISRLLALILLSLTGQRRKAGEMRRKSAGKLCLNILLEEDRLEQNNKDIYLAHEVLQMRVLWERGGIYQKYLEDNSWAFRFLPNWVGSSGQVVSSKYYVLRGKAKNTHNTYYIILNTIGDLFENLAKSFQLWYMRSPKGMERIEDGALYFHPEDCRPRILSEYNKRVSTTVSPK